ncbi:MAG: hypothetical protein AB1Z98_23280 [Nannocystaceae bacterium]
MRSAHVILVPGLLGFQRLGALSYFTEVEGVLAEPFEEAGIDVRVTAIRTLPTSSLRARAARLAEVVTEVPGHEEVYIAGHSTGGLDCRLFMAPGASLPTTVDVPAATARVRAVVTVATPHHGAPLASVFTGVHGHRLMSVVSRALTFLLRGGSSSMSTIVEVGKIVLLLDRLLGMEETVRNPLREQLRAGVARLGGEDPGIPTWLDDIGEDSTLLEQLTPAAVELLNTTLQESSDLRRGSVVAMAPPARLRSLAHWRVDPYARLSTALYLVLHRLAGSSERDEPVLEPEQRLALQQMLGVMPRRRDNDGFVPTLSQVWGTVVAAVHGDHLDLMGYYGGRPEQPRLDMLTSGARFGWRDFHATWTAVSRFMLEG